jgi:DNA-binding transcriptional LysR family regulator
MEMHQVRYFLALCKELHFTRAAKRCGVAQPSLTNAIKALEQELGGTLFHRGYGDVRLSELGRVVEPYLRKIDRFAQAAKRKAADLNPSQSRPRGGFNAKVAISRRNHRNSNSQSGLLDAGNATAATRISAIDARYFYR